MHTLYLTFEKFIVSKSFFCFKRKLKNFLFHQIGADRECWRMTEGWIVAQVFIYILEDSFFSFLSMLLLLLLFFLFSRFFLLPFFWNKEKVKYSVETWKWMKKGWEVDNILNLFLRDNKMFYKTISLLEPENKMEKGMIMEKKAWDWHLLLWKIRKKKFIKEKLYSLFKYYLSDLSLSLCIRIKRNWWRSLWWPNAVINDVISTGRQPFLLKI